MRRLAAVSLVAATAVGVLWTASRDDPPARTQPPTAKQVVGFINHQRALRGLHTLRLSTSLSRAARRWSSHLHATGRFFHASSGPRFRWSAETLYRGSGGPVRAWLNSPPHRAILLNERARIVGVGRSGNVWTARFAAR